MTPPQLHPLEFRILLVLIDGPSHGYRIVQAIEARDPDAAVWPANLYRRIRDLLGRGLIEETAPPAGETAERRRTHVRLTERGRAVAAEEARRLAALVEEARAADLLPGGRRA